MKKYVTREISDKVLEVQKYYPVTTITGPRQSGKTSLCRHLFPDYSYVNLEDLTIRGRAITDPTGFIDSLGKTAIIDEVQNVPELLSMIQVRVDEDPEKRFILTGSSNFSPLHRMTQSLAGRVALFTLLPFSELMKNQYNRARIPNINFYRERSGKEVDAIVNTPDGLHLYEMKAGSTFKPEFAANMQYVSELLPEVSQRTVIYDGPTSAPLLLNLRDI